MKIQKKLAILFMLIAIIFVVVVLAADKELDYNIPTLIAGILIIDAVIMVIPKINTLLFCIAATCIYLMINFEYIFAGSIKFSLIVSAALIVILSIVLIKKKHIHGNLKC